MNRRIKVLIAIAILSAVLFLRFQIGHRSVIPSQIRSLKYDDFLVLSLREVEGEEKPDFDGDGRSEKVVLYWHSLTRVFLAVKWSDDRGSETIGKVIGEDYDVMTRVFLTDMNGDGRKELAALTPAGRQKTNLSVWKFDENSRKMRIVGITSFSPIFVFDYGGMQVLNIDGDEGKEIISFRTSSLASFLRYREAFALDLCVAWLDGNKPWSKSKKFVAFKTVRLPIPTFAPMKWVQHFEAKVLVANDKRFLAVPFIATVQDVNFWDMLSLRYVLERDKVYAAVFEVRDADPDSWQFLGRIF